MSDDTYVSVTESRELALRSAVEAMRERFDKLACAIGEADAAKKVLVVADVFLAWLRQVGTITLTLVAIEEQNTGELVLPLPPGGIMTTFDTSQQGRWVITANDDRGFPLDATLSVAVESGAEFVSAELVEATTGTASGKDELVVKALAPGSALVKVFDPANPTTIFGSVSVDVVTAASPR